MSPIVYFTIPVFIALLGLELFLSRRYRGERPIRGYTRPDTLASLAMGVGNVLLNIVTKSATVALLVVLHEVAIFDLGSEAWVWLILIPAEDLCYYGFHRLHHEVRFLWAAHVNHHSSRHFNLSTALRQPWTTPFTGLIFWWPLALIGFQPWMILTAQGISLLYQFWIHTELIGKLGPLEWILNTPSHHRVHHGRNVRYLDRNYAGIFIIWDRLFGTFEPEGEPVDFGLTRNIETFNPISIAFHEWIGMLRDTARASSWRDRLAYLLQPPGWSATGEDRTARALRAAQLPMPLPR